MWVCLIFSGTGVSGAFIREGAVTRSAGDVMALGILLPIYGYFSCIFSTLPPDGKKAKGKRKFYGVEPRSVLLLLA